MKNNDDTWTAALRWAFSHSLPWLVLVAAALAPVVAIPAASASAHTAAVSYVTADIPPCDGTQAPDEVCTPSPDPLPTATPTPPPAPPVVTTPPPVVVPDPGPTSAPSGWLPVVGPPWNDPSVPGGVQAARACNPARWVAMETVPGTTEAQSAFRRVSPEVVVTWPGLPDAAFCPVAAPVAAPVAKKVAAPVAKPQVARIPIGGIPAGDGSTAMPKMLPRTGPAYPTWAIGVFALGCFALGGLMLLLGNRPAKPLPVRKDAGAISLHALGRDAAVVAACLVVSAGTFLAIARATHQPVTTLVQAVFTPTAEQADPWGSPVQDRGRQMTSDEWGVVVPGQAYMGFLETDGVAKLRQVGPPAVAVPGCPFTNVGQDFPLGLGAACPVPAVLSGADLPGGTVIRVHTAAGTNENCTHTTGYGYSTDGQLAIGDGWKCAR